MKDLVNLAEYAEYPGCLGGWSRVSDLMSKKKRRGTHSDSGPAAQTRVDSAHSDNGKAKAGQTLLAALSKKILQAVGSESNSTRASEPNEAELALEQGKVESDRLKIANPLESTAPEIEDAATENTATENTATENAATENTATENTATENTATENAATENAATENTATENAATENAATENVATGEQVESHSSKTKLRVDAAVSTVDRGAPVHSPHEPQSYASWPSVELEFVEETPDVDVDSNSLDSALFVDDVDQREHVVSDSEIERKSHSARSSTELTAEPPSTVSADENEAGADAQAKALEEAVDPDIQIHNANMQLQLQASQLAGHLQQRKFDLQRRENEVNAQLASWDHEHRDVELVLQQRVTDLTDRELEMSQLAADLECQVAEIATAAVAAERDRQHWHGELESRERMLADRESDLQNLQHQLHRQQTALVSFQQQSQTDRARAKDLLRLEQQKWSNQRSTEKEQLERLSSNVERNRRQLVAEQSKHDERLKLQWTEFQKQCAEATAEKQQYLEDEETRISLLESIFTQRTEELALEQSAFVAECQSWEAERQKQYQELAELQRSGHTELENRGRELDKRQRFLEKRTEALEVLQSDVSKLHKACLEMRLVTEQVWADLSDRADAGQMTHRIAQARRQWSEFVQDELRQVEERKGQVAGLLTRLQEEHKRLASEKGELRKWIDRRYREIEEQATRLIARQRELNEESLRTEQSKKEWQAKEKQLRREILELQTQLNQRRAA
jgi:hypothetical protein